MAVNPVPFCLAEPSVEHSADLVRQAVSSLLNPAGGTVAAGGLTVSAQEPAKMAVNVEGGDPNGQIWIPGTSQANQGMYFASNDSTTALTIGAASEANPRIDTVIARIFDKFYAGSENKFALEVLPGTPTGGLVKAPKTRAEAEADKAAALPASCLVLAYILVPKSAASIVAGNIENVAIQAVSGLTLPNEAVTDAKVVKGRALLETENAWGAQKSLATETEYEPSATRRTEVIAQVAISIPEESYTLVVGGVILNTIKVEKSGEPGASNNAFYFTVNPKEKWKITGAAGVTVFTNYRTI